MRNIISYIFIILLAMSAQAQTQQGYIKTIGRPNKKGEPLSNVSIRVKGAHNAVLSDEKGKFVLLMHGKKNGDSYALQQVRKSGYQLNDAGVIGRSFAFSDRVPHTIVMVSTSQLQKDKQRIENNAYRVAEKNYEEKLTRLEQQVNDSVISMDKYREELQTLQESFEKYQLMIDGLADHYAHTDYDNLNAKEREINICIENGDLERADSLIHTVFNPETVLERNRAAKEEIRKRIEFAQKVIDKANADKEAFRRDEEYAERVSLLSEKLAKEYIAQEEWQKAIESLGTALEIKRFLHGEDDEKVKEIINTITDLKKKQETD